MSTQLEQLLRRVVIALNDWTHMYAEELCDPENVKNAKHRIEKAGGTIAYIADLVADINEALRQLSLHEPDTKMSYELYRALMLNRELLKALKDPRSRYGYGNEDADYHAVIAKAEEQV